MTVDVEDGIRGKKHWRGAACCIPRSDRDNEESDGVDTHQHQAHVCQYRYLHEHQQQRTVISTDHEPSLSIQSGPHGLHAIASRDITAGSVIVQCLPLAHSILVPPGSSLMGDDDEDSHDCGRRKRCARCFFQEGDEDTSKIRKKTFGRCSKCRVAFYCSRSCQADDWEEQHKLECQYYVKRRKQSPMSSSFYANSPDEDAIPLLLRSFNSLKYLREKSDATKKNLNSHQKDDECNQQGGIAISCGPLHFASLMVSPDHDLQASCNTSAPMSLAKDLIENYAVRGKSSKIENEKSTETKQSAAQGIWGYTEEKDGYTTDHAIQRTLNAFKKNNFGIVNSLHSPIGEGVYPCAALLNHSCYPNCILRYKLGVVDASSSGKQKYHPPILQIVACRDIVSGEELCHSYVDLALCTRERQARLLDTHGFVCKCKRCTKGGCLVELPNNKNDWELWPLTNGLLGAGTDKISLVAIDIEDAMTEWNGFSESEHAHVLQKSHTLQQQANQCMIEDDSLGELSYLKEAISLYSTKGNRWVSPFFSQLYFIRCSYLSALLANGQVIEATVECEHIVSFLAVAFSHVQHHPLLGLQLYTLGDLYSGAAVIEDSSVAEQTIHSYKQKAELAYAWAKRVMIVTHGASDPMVQTLEDNLSS